MLCAFSNEHNTILYTFFDTNKNEIFRTFSYKVGTENLLYLKKTFCKASAFTFQVYIWSRDENNSLVFFLSLPCAVINHCWSSWQHRRQPTLHSGIFHWLLKMFFFRSNYFFVSRIELPITSFDLYRVNWQLFLNRFQLLFTRPARL